MSRSDRVSALLAGSLLQITVPSPTFLLVVSTRRRLAAPLPGLGSAMVTPTLNVRPFLAPAADRPADFTVAVGALLSMLT